MKTGSTILALLVLAFLGSSCTTMNRFSTEYEEETTRVKQMSPEEKAAWEQQQHQDFKIEMRGFDEDTE
jgi:hypothetical protein